MLTIWKYKVEPDFVNQIIEMPKGALILSFGLDANDELCFWAQVDDSAPLEEHVIACVGTGWSIDHVCDSVRRYACFIGTVTHGDYVWHLFDLGGAAIDDLEVATLSSIEEAMAHEASDN